MSDQPLKSWLQASRPLAHFNIALPLGLGQAVAFSATGRFQLEAALWIHGFGILDHLFIVFANDYADREADAANPSPTLVSGGSRVLVEGKLTPVALRRAAGAALGGLGALSFGQAITQSAIGWVVAWVAAALLLWAYSFPPLRLSYRGSGELLQGIGVGGVLPLLGCYGQIDTVTPFPWLLLGSCVLLGIAGNVATALPDTEADRLAHKRTWPVRFGEPAARRSAMFLTVAAFWLAGIGTPWIPLSHRIALAAASTIFLAMTFFGFGRRTRFGFVIAQSIGYAVFTLGLIAQLVASTPA